MYRLHGHPKTRTMRTLWILEELEVPFTLNPVAPRSEEAFAVSPTGKVPILETEDGPIADSVAQMTYLTDRHGRFTEAPGSYARGRQDAFTQLINETMDAVLWAYAKHSFVLPEAQRVPEVKPSLKAEFEHYATDLAGRLVEGPYLMGAEPLVPDFLLAQCCGWAASREFALPDALRGHMTTMRARPAFRRVVKHG